MELEKIIAEIEALEQMFRLPDTRNLDERLARNPWFQLWNT
jgi:hypothetical protein